MKEKEFEFMVNKMRQTEKNVRKNLVDLFQSFRQIQNITLIIW